MEGEVVSPITCTDSFDPNDPHALFTDGVAEGPMATWAWYCLFLEEYGKGGIKGST